MNAPHFLNLAAISLHDPEPQYRLIKEKFWLIVDIKNTDWVSVIQMDGPYDSVLAAKVMGANGHVG